MNTGLQRWRISLENLSGRSVSEDQLKRCNTILRVVIIRWDTSLKKVFSLQQLLDIFLLEGLPTPFSCLIISFRESEGGEALLARH